MNGGLQGIQIKNWFSLKKDIERVLEGTAIPQPNDKVIDKKLVKVGKRYGANK